jgi:hypothetical protein
MKRLCKQLKKTDAAVFSLFGQSFLFSTNTLTYFPLTECAKDILLSDTWKDDLIEESIRNKYSQKEIEKTCLKLKEFVESKILVPIKAHTKGVIYYNDYYLKLILSARCNLKCSYCFAQKERVFDMSLHTAKKAILFFLDKFIPDGDRRYIIDLTGAGEPLLCLELILAINDFVLQIKKDRNINIFCQLATNGMLLTKKISTLLKKKCILFGVSLDGKKEISEKNRTGLNYELVSKNIRELENKDFFGIAATYSANNHDFIEIFKTLYSFSPEVVGMKPVRLLENDENSINIHNIEEIKDSYDRFTKWIYKQLIGGNKAYFDAFMGSEDFFARFLKITLRPFRLFYRCSAGVNSFAVDGKGNLMICPAFIGKKEGVIGNLETGFDQEKKANLENLYADKIKYCKKCWARYTCAGECFAVGFANYKIFEKPSPIMCELKKYLIQLSVYFWTCLRYEHEEIYKSCVEKY